MKVKIVGLVFAAEWLAVLLGFSGSLTFARAEEGVLTRKTLTFSDYVWKVKSSEKRVGPGSNYFSDSTDNVWVDEAGRLHLKITQTDGQWHCAEVVSEKSFGLGKYSFHIVAALAKLDPNVTLGLFTWSDAPDYAHREIDIECSKWGNVNDTNNAQFVVQPYQPRGRLLRYHIPEDLGNVISSFTWQSNNVAFKCVAENENASSTNAKVIEEWHFTGDRVPVPGDENVRMNLWLGVGHGPTDTNNTEIIISKFEFLPIDAQPYGARHGGGLSTSSSESPSK